MKILIVGGTGLIGGRAAIHLSNLGHDITIASRNPPGADTPMAAMPFLQGNYIEDDFTTEQLAGFDALVFAAGQDTRHVAPGTDAAAHWERGNVEAVPRFFERARDSGIGTAVYIGSFYPQAAPHLVAGNPYISARERTDIAVRALNRPDFRVVSLNPPFMIGTVPGIALKGFQRLTDFAQGKLPDIPLQAPPGGVNYMSIQSLAEAIAGALERGEGGKAYLVGDENISFHDYFQRYFRAVGNDSPIPLVDEPHPLAGNFAGHGGTIYFDPDPQEAAFLGYSLGVMDRTIGEITAQYRA